MSVEMDAEMEMAIALGVEARPVPKTMLARAPEKTDKKQRNAKDGSLAIPSGLAGFVVAEVCQRLDIEPADLMGRARHKRISEARQLAFSVLRALDYSLSEIGRVFRRDHSSVLYGIQKFKQRTGPPGGPENGLKRVAAEIEARARKYRFAHDHNQPLRPEVFNAVRAVVHRVATSKMQTLSRDLQRSREVLAVEVVLNTYGYNAADIAHFLNKSKAQVLKNIDAYHSKGPDELRALVRKSALEIESLRGL